MFTFSHINTHTNTHTGWLNISLFHTITAELFTHSLFICKFRHTRTLQLSLHVSALRALSPSVQTFSKSPLMENCTSLFQILAAPIPISFTAATIALADGQHRAARPQCKESRHYPISWESPGGYMLLTYRHASTQCGWSTGLRFKGTWWIYQAGHERHMERHVNICSVERT